jgi:hypothetical protein
MWQKVGLLRDQNSLGEALSELEQLGRDSQDARVPDFASYNPDWIDLLELGNMIRLGQIIARCALERRESRGGHVRMDHPELDDAHWLQTVIAEKSASQQNGDIAIRTDPMEGVWDHIRPPGFVERLPASLQELALRNLPRGVVQRILRKRVADFVPGEST